MRPLVIGNVRLDNPLILAPMAGVTDLPFRLLCKEQGCGMVVTEMVSEVNLNQMMFQRVTGASYILADSSKFGERAGGVSCPPEKIENIITDMNAPADMLREFREMGTWVYQVD